MYPKLWDTFFFFLNSFFLKKKKKKKKKTLKIESIFYNFIYLFIIFLGN